ncbi:MAG: hypothetical protein WCV41_00660 [Patescibacteria group bacterium]
MEITPEQFNSLATKDDLKNFATKDDIKAIREEMATKDDLKKVDEKVDRVIVSLLKTQEDVKEMKEVMSTKEDINKILNAVDMAIGQYQEVKIEQLSNVSAHDRFETRITNIEGHLNLKPAV